LTGLPPVRETIVEPNAFDEKVAGGNPGPTVCSAFNKDISVAVPGEQ
jgi:hypothetical protein